MSHLERGMGSTGGVILTKTKCLERNLSQCHFSTTNSERNAMEADPDLRSKKMATNQP
jgi:hypothetical protein